MTQNITSIEENADRSNQKSDSGFYIYSVIESATQATILLLMVIFGVLGNLYCVGVIYKNKKLRNPTFIFLCNLALSNISALLMCSPFPLITSFYRRNVLGAFWCRASGFLNNLFFCVSIITFSLIATQKYYTVVRPSRWTFLHITKTKARYLVSIVWIICAVLSLMILGPFEKWNYVVFNMTTAHCGISFPRNVSDRVRLGMLALVAFIVPICVMSYAYGRIYLKVRAHERNMRSRRMVSIKGKLAITLGLMFGTFVFCWFPFFLLIVFSIAFQRPSDLPWSLGRLAYWSGYLNCCINPTLYCWRSSAFREALRPIRSSLARRAGEPFDRRAAQAARHSRRALSLPTPLGRSVGRSQFVRTQRTQKICLHQSEHGKLPRLRSLSFSSKYDLTKVCRTNDDSATDFPETYISLDNGARSNNCGVMSTFGAQHALLSLSGKSVDKPAVTHKTQNSIDCQVLPSAKSPDTDCGTQTCGKNQESETYI